MEWLSCPSSSSWDPLLVWACSAPGRVRVKEQAEHTQACQGLSLELAHCHVHSFTNGQATSGGQVKGEEWGHRLHDEPKWKLAISVYCSSQQSRLWNWSFKSVALHVLMAGPLSERGKSFDFQSSGHLLGPASGSL